MVRKYKSKLSTKNLSQPLEYLKRLLNLKTATSRNKNLITYVVLHAQEKGRQLQETFLDLSNT